MDKATLLSKEELGDFLDDYDAWIFDEQAVKLVSGFEFPSFRDAVNFVEVISDLAEEMGHHPDILLHDYKFVTLFLSTHEVEGVSDRDVEFAKRVEKELTEITNS